MKVYNNFTSKLGFSFFIVINYIFNKLKFLFQTAYANQPIKNEILNVVIQFK